MQKDDKMKYLHIFTRSNFTEPYIEFINNNFDSQEHLFIIYGKERGLGVKVSSRVNVKELSKQFRSISLLIREMYKSKKIFLHGLFSPLVVLLLFMQPWLLKKCYWGIWGGDLWHYELRKKTNRSDVYEFFRKFVIKNMGGVITHINGDYKLAQKWYGAKAKYYYSFMYPSNLFKEYDLPNVKKADEKTYIQVGNSANSTNNHLEIFDKLKKYKEEKIEIICPLSYGNTEYRDKVIEEGTKIFGEKFNPIIEFMAFGEYLELLAKIDVAIFNHNRQEAMGNITTLLGLGKKVYIRDDITTWGFCIEHELKVFSINKDFNDFFGTIDENIRQKNIFNVKRQFSEEKLKNDWNKIFESNPCEQVKEGETLE